MAEPPLAGDSAIRRWLLGIPDEPRGLKRTREPDMATPPSSTFNVGRSNSPSKKRKVDQGGQPEDEDEGPGEIPQTDAPSQGPALSIRPGSFFPPSSAGYGQLSTSLASDRQSSRRSSSPVKNLNGLQRLYKPVLYCSLLGGKAGFQQLPEDVQQLYSDILVVTSYRKGIYPVEIRPQIENLEDSSLPDSVYREEGAKEWKEEEGGEEEEEEEGPFFDYLPLSALFADKPEVGSRQARYALAELHKIRAIERVARACLSLGRSEAAWNAQVHGPLLELAVSRQRGSVAYENATSARILPPFRPFLATGEMSEGKMVDFVLAPRLSPEVDAVIQSGLNEVYMRTKTPSLASAQLNVNQTDYVPLTRSPLAVSIETKVAGASLTEGRLQLGIWTAAWHRRMEILGVGGGKQGPLLPTLPLILVQDHQWSLYLAVDRLDRIEICGLHEIGSSSNFSNIYQLLAVLELLAGWVDTVFRSWVIKTFNPHPSVTADADADADVDVDVT